MSSRQIVLDTETTGLDPSQGHRVIEIGCLELINRRPTGRSFHRYLNPDREIDRGAEEVHGLTDDFLADKPRFEEIAAELIEFLAQDALIIHNAPFDLGFLDAEFKRFNASSSALAERHEIIDTLVLARKQHPGQRNSLDALCRRYAVDNSGRDLHGALLDARLLSDVYLAMTGGQTALTLDAGAEADHDSAGDPLPVADGAALRVILASEAERSAHEQRLEAIDSVSDGACVWLREESRS